MRRSVALLVALAVMFVGNVGCSSSRAGKGAGVGAAIGAIFGAALAVATGREEDALAYAAAGGAIGAAVGYEIGKARDKKLADRDAAVQAANYLPSQGFQLTIKSIEALPTRVAPGNNAQVRVTWMAISPNPSESIQVRAALVFRTAGGQQAAATSEDLQLLANGGGIVETTVDLPIPAKAPTGSYAFDVQLSDSMSRVERSGSVPVFIG